MGTSSKYSVQSKVVRVALKTVAFQSVIDLSFEMADTDIASMTVVELKEALKAKGLTTSGKKQDLIDRLQLAMEPQDDDLLEDANVLLGEDDDDIPLAIKKPVTKTVEKPKPAKITSPIKLDESKPKGSEETADTENKTEKKGGMTDAERAAARAAKFGSSISGPDVASEAKKQSRAERFGIKVGKIGDAPTADLETLKKRAERFGQSSATAMKKAEMDEKIRKRQERFGVVEPEVKKFKKAGVLANVELNKTLKTDDTKSADTEETEEQKKKRAERFGVITPIVMDEKLQKRAERFGAVKV